MLYRDFHLSFGADPLSGNLLTVEDEAAVAQSVRTLILTSLYERPFQPALGSIIYRLLFEPFDAITKQVLAQTIKDVVTQFESRATVKFVDFYEGRGPNNELIDDNTLCVVVGFYVYNKPNLVTTNVLLRRTR